MPSVQRAHDEYKKSGVPVIAVSIDGDGEKSVKPFLAEHKSYTLPVPLDPDMGVARAVGVRVAPSNSSRVYALIETGQRGSLWRRNGFLTPANRISLL